MTRITGQQAQQLLDGATSGPWGVETYRTDEIFGEPTEFVTDVGPIGALWLNTSPDACLTGSPMDHRLAAAAPALAETVAWLYGREPDAEAVDGTERHWRDQTILTSRGTGALAMFKGNFIGHGDEMTPDEAVDLARALLAAAEEARRDQ